jgi:type II secretory pathway pseudopilin PulG
LVVILIISILAALAIAVFLRQRERGWVAQVQAALANSRIAAESYRADPSNTNFSGLNLGELTNEGLRYAPTVTVDGGPLPGDPSNYCIIAVHFELDPGNDWQIATYNSEVGEQSTDDTCS